MKLAKKDPIKIQEENLLESDDDNKTPPSDVIAFNELRSCADLFRLVKSEQLDTNPDFQRGEIWKSAEKTRFIDSLVKQLPIPSMCFSIDAKTAKRLVIDGLQRTSSVIAFLDTEIMWKLSNLDDIDERLRNKTNIEVKKDHPELWSIVENTMIPITVIRCDYNQFYHMEYLYTIFHRLNTNAVKLNNQEVRNCIFNGPFNSILKDLSVNRFVRDVYGNSKRLSTAEYLLRALAFTANLDSYKGKMSTFLNNYMFDHRFDSGSGQQSLILRTAEVISAKIIPNSKFKTLSRTTIEGLMIGIMSNIESLSNKTTDELVTMYDVIVKSDEFGPESLSEGLSSTKKVLARLRLAKQTFKG